MPTITNGVEVSVSVTFDQEESDIVHFRFVYVYEVTIANLNSFPVRLVSRKWEIFDSNGVVEEVEGEGVLGQTPLIDPQMKHTYQSWAVISSSLGKMKGSYLMRKSDGESFWVTIPAFELVFPAKLN